VSCPFTPLADCLLRGGKRTPRMPHGGGARREADTSDSVLWTLCSGLCALDCALDSVLLALGAVALGSWLSVLGSQFSALSSRLSVLGSRTVSA
jgi:hypothetical protein